MNKRMEHCLYQAGLTASGCWEDLDTYTQEGIEKFAELIVAECIKLCEHNSNDDEYDQFDMGQSVKAENIKASIMKEFGVEE